MNDIIKQKYDFPYEITRIESEGGRIFRYVQPIEFYQYMASSYHIYFYTIINNEIWFPEKSGVNKLIFK